MCLHQNKTSHLHQNKTSCRERLEVHARSTWFRLGTEGRLRTPRRVLVCEELRELSLDGRHFSWLGSVGGCLGGCCVCVYICHSRVYMHALRMKIAWLGRWVGSSAACEGTYIVRLYACAHLRMNMRLFERHAYG
jgi:hypothetical protein